MADKAHRAESVIRCLRNGYTLDDAARKSGVSPSTVAKWRHKGRIDVSRGLDTWYADFLEKSEDARCHACSMVDNQLYAAALDGGFGAAEKWFERFAPEGYEDRAAEIRKRHAEEICKRLGI